MSKRGLRTIFRSPPSSTLGHYLIRASKAVSSRPLKSITIGGGEAVGGNQHKWRGKGEGDQAGHKEPVLIRGGERGSKRS